MVYLHEVFIVRYYSVCKLSQATLVVESNHKNALVRIACPLVIVPPACQISTK